MKAEDYYALERLLDKLRELGYRVCVSNGAQDGFAIGLYDQSGKMVNSCSSYSIEDCIKKLTSQ